MPHLTIQYSANLDDLNDLQALCDSLHETMVKSGVFPLGGIRVRAIAAVTYAIADLHPENAFADLVLRMGAGRSQADKKAAGVAIVEAAEQFFQAELESPHFALSFEIIEIDADLSWKINSIHPRLN